jgi:hypothetical protein
MALCILSSEYVYILYVWKETQGVSCIEEYPKETRSVTANVWEEYIIVGFRRPNDVVLIHLRLQLNTGPPSVVTSELWHTEEDEVADTESDKEGLDVLWLHGCTKVVSVYSFLVWSSWCYPIPDKALPKKKKSFKETKRSTCCC